MSWNEIVTIVCAVIAVAGSYVATYYAGKAAGYRDRIRLRL